jgi:hypothetical protein
VSTSIHTERIDGPATWVGSDFSGKDDISYSLSDETRDALVAVGERIRPMERYDVELEHCHHPDLDREARDVYEELMRGRGLVIVRRFPVEGFPVEDVEAMYWAWCSHFGRLVSNNSFGHRMVRVQAEMLPNGVQPARGTKSNAELAMHNDAADILSLLWIHQAKEGGASQFASGAAAHNTILATNPEILPILYRGFPHHRRSEQPDDQPDVTPYDVPIFSNVDGRICINFTYSSILPALHELGRSFSEEEERAVNILREVLVRQQVEVWVGPGEIAMANNFAMCHSRTAFVDGDRPEERRLILRAWMEVPIEDRRLPIGRQFFHMENEGGRLGYDPVPGREGRIAINDYNNVDEDLANLFKAAQAKPKID